MTRFLQLAALLTGLTTASAAAEEWKVIQSESRLGFVATYDDIPFDAWFRSFDAQIRFSPERLDQSAFDVRIDVASLDSDSADRDEGMQSEEWFATDEHPDARFHTEGFEHESGNRYVAIGELRLKNVSETIRVPFTWEPQPDGGAVMAVETTLQRGDFDIGTGDWAEDDIIGFDVTVTARLVLSPR